MKIKKEFLQSHALFGGITDADIEQIIPLLKEETFDKGAFIIREDEEGDMLHFIVEGSVEVVKRTHDEKDSYQQLAIFGPGDTSVCHKPNEFGVIEEVQKAKKYYKKIIRHYLT